MDLGGSLSVDGYQNFDGGGLTSQEIEFNLQESTERVNSAIALTPMQRF